MVDTHAHILPGLDDGAETMQQTIKLLERAVSEGITDIIATPHGFHPNFITDIGQIETQLKIVKEYIVEHQMPIDVHAGMECRLSDKLPELLLTGDALTLAGSRYVLLELPSSGVPAYAVQIIQRLILSDYVPIIAHAERNQGIIQKPERLQQLLLHGALAQVTAGSVDGSFGKAIQKTAMTLIEANMVHVFGSDVHNLEARPFKFNEGLNYLEKKNRFEIVDLLLENNERIIKNSDLIVMEPRDLTKTKWWNFFS